MSPLSAAPALSANHTDAATAWTRFATRAATDPALFAELEKTSDRDAFATLAVRQGTRLALRFTEKEVHHAIQLARHGWLLRHAGPASLPGLAPTPLPRLETDAPPSPNWLPIYVAPRRFSHGGGTPAEPQLEWACFGDLALTEPFFEQSIGAALRHPARLLFRRHTSLEALQPLADSAPDLAPGGFVFHVSRCGSTLVAQTLAADPRHRVLSEAAPIDQLLTLDAANPALTLAQRASRLRGLVHAYARRRRPEETRLFIKFDAWHTLHLPVIRAAFPATPWIFLHRDPVEVLVSQHRQRGFQFIPGVMDPRLFGIAPQDLPSLDFDAYTARVIRATCDAALLALATPDAAVRVVDYRDLRRLLPDLLHNHFGVPDDETSRAALAAASPRNSKNPSAAFTADSEAKHREADDELRAIAAHWLAEPRESLLRLQTR